ncbi:peptidoglycan-binding protein [Haladaptatus sp. DYSN1]|uniref:peptidoglycan hydrolase n=1 Tax=unclassified Haladaptatus TaxID=2622732 RepID=UPI0024055F90|nr:peptidoglycan-binding protein [Haladaptatus sp. DYSN1]
MGKKWARRNFLRTVGATALTLPVMTTTAAAAQADFVWPVSDHINSPYGPRGSGYHYGVDIDGETEDPIYASRAGTAYAAEDPSGYGQYIYIDHGDGYVSEYGHVNSYDVYDGEWVERGEQIAGMGTTGSSTGVHVHLEIEHDGSPQSIPGDKGDWVTQGEPIPKDFPGIGGTDTDNYYSWPTYSRGDQSEGVYSIQYLLEEQGYNLNYHDGIYGSEVENTVESFQSSQGLSVDGIVGPNTWEELYVTVYDANNDPYWATYGAQHHLRYDQGYSISVDGYYGPETEGAVEDFQSNAGLTVDGIVGHDTWQALMDL